MKTLTQKNTTQKMSQILKHHLVPWIIALHLCILSYLKISAKLIATSYCRWTYCTQNWKVAQQKNIISYTTIKSKTLTHRQFTW